MTVSVIIPLFNAELYVADAIRSVLAQDYPPHEVIVVDDGSTDGGGGAVEAFPEVRLLTQENAGAGPARNHGVRASSGELIAFLDADDLWLPGKLRRQVDWLQANPQADMVFGWVTQFSDANPERTIAPMRGYFAGTMLIRRGSLSKAGEFPQQYRVGEFIDWYARAQEAGLVAGIIDEVVHRRRIHQNNMGVREKSHQGDFARIAKAALDRRRRTIV